MVFVGPPGTGKSQALKDASLQPLRDLQDERDLANTIIEKCTSAALVKTVANKEKAFVVSPELFEVINKLLKSDIGLIVGNQLDNRLVEFIPKWREITSDPNLLQYVQGVEISFIEGIVPRQQTYRPSVFNGQQHEIVQNEIQSLLSKGVLRESHSETGEFVSTIFLRHKNDGSFRMILNLKQFNESVEYHHFKMDTLETVTRMMKPGCFMASVDLKDAYYTVPIHSDVYV